MNDQNEGAAQRPPSLVLALVIGILGALAAFLPDLLSIRPETALPAAPRTLLRVVGFTFSWFALVGIPIGLLLHLPKSTRPGARFLLAAGLANLAVICPLYLVNDREHARAMKSFEARMAPLIVAINRFDRDHAALPVDLKVLVPRYLSGVPSTGLGFAPTFRYGVADTLQLTARQVLYHLGSTSAPPDSLSSTWRSHSWPAPSLNFDLNSRGEILRSALEGVPAGVVSEAFDSVRWKTAPSERQTLARSALALFPKGFAYSVVHDALGPPDEVREPWFPRWWLIVPGTPPLLYSPNQKLPESLGGYLETQYGDWWSIGS